MKKGIIYIVILFLITLTSCNSNQINNNPKSNTKTGQIEQILPTSCVDKEESNPVITSISTFSWNLNTKIQIKWCNFSGFEWDKNVWIENKKGLKWILYGQEWSNSKTINIILESTICQYDNSYSGLECDSILELTPWDYKIYTMPWWRISNKVDFTIY